MSSKSPEETAKMVFQALNKTNQHAVVYSGWGGLSKTELPDNVLMVESVPHSWLFPRVRAVIHHGGAGTTAAGLKAGVPSVVVPFHGDQPFWGHMIEKLGVGPKSIPRKKLSIIRLVNAIEKVINDKEMSENATRLSSEIQAENGIEEAVSIINDTINN